MRQEETRGGARALAKAKEARVKWGVSYRMMQIMRRRYWISGDLQKKQTYISGLLMLADAMRVSEAAHTRADGTEDVDDAHAVRNEDITVGGWQAHVWDRYASGRGTRWRGT